MYIDDMLALEQELIQKITTIERKIALLEHENYELREELEYVQQTFNRNRNHEI